MNALQYWIIDSYIKAKKQPDPSGTMSPTARLSSSSYSRRNRHSFDDSEDIFSSDEDGEGTATDGVEQQNLLPHSKSIVVTRKHSSSTSDYDPDIDGDNTPGKSRHHDSEASSTYNAIRSGVKPTGKRDRLNGGSTAESLSSMMLLPGSRGPSTPGYGDDADSRRLTLSSARSVGGRSGMSLGGDDDSTLVGRDED